LLILGLKLFFLLFGGRRVGRGLIMALPFFEETGIHFPPPLLLPYTGVAYLSISLPTTLYPLFPLPYEAPRKSRFEAKY